MQIKFEPVFITVAAAEDEEPLRDLTNSVHINALKKNTRRNDNTLEIMTIVSQTDESEGLSATL